MCLLFVTLIRSANNSKVYTSGNKKSQKTYAFLLCDEYEIRKENLAFQSVPSLIIKTKKKKKYHLFNWYISFCSYSIDYTTLFSLKF